MRIQYNVFVPTFLNSRHLSYTFLKINALSILLLSLNIKQAAKSF